MQSLRMAKNDRELMPVLIQLCDVWGANLILFSFFHLSELIDEIRTWVHVSPEVAKMIAGLAADRSDSSLSGVDPRTAATSYMLSEITANPVVRSIRF